MGSKRLSNGFTLIELMVAMVLSTFIMWCLLRIFSISTELTSLTTYDLENYENVRMALERVKRELKLAMGVLGSSSDEAYFRIGVEWLDPSSAPAGYTVSAERYGTATASGTNWLRDENRSWRVDEFRGLLIYADGAYHRITRNTDTIVYIEDTWSNPGNYYIPYLWARIEFCLSTGEEVGYRVYYLDYDGDSSYELETESVLRRWVATDGNFSYPGNTIWEYYNPSQGSRDDLALYITDALIEYYDGSTNTFRLLLNNQLPSNRGDVSNYDTNSLSYVGTVLDNSGYGWLEFGVLPRALRITVRGTDQAERTAHTYQTVILLPQGGNLQ